MSETFYSLKADHGKFACAEDGGGLPGQIIANRPAGLMTATRDSIGAWESFSIVPSEDGDETYGLKSCHGFYACCENAEDDAAHGRNGIIVFNRESLGAWEKFKLIIQENGTKVSFESVARPTYFIKAHPTGQVTLEHSFFDGAISDSPGGYETFTVDPPLVSSIGPSLITGQLRISSVGWCDDSGPVLPIGLHVGDLFSKFVRDPNHSENIIRQARDAGYSYIHFWMNLGTLGGDYWAGRECGPGYTSDFWGQLSRLGDLLDRYGMKGGYNLGDYTLWSGTHKDFFRELGRHLRGRTNCTAAYVFGGNEAWQTGASSKEEISDALEGFTEECNTVPITTTAPPTEEKYDIANWCGGDFYAIHGFRDGEDHDRIRHIFSVNWEGEPSSRYGIQDEPTGPGDEVSVKARHCYEGRDVDANHMCALAVQSLLCDQGFNFFCSDGVKSDGDITRWGGFYELPKAAKIVPIDIMAWPRTFHFGSSQSDKRVFSPCADDTLRFDHRISHDGRIFGMFYGDEGSTQTRCEQSCFLQFIDWNGNIHHEQHFNRGDIFTFNFRRSSNGEPNGYTAQVVVGRLE